MKKLFTPKVLLLGAILFVMLLMVTVMFIVFAQFKTLKVTAGTGGRVFGGGDFRKEQVVEVNAIPDEGYVFVAWYKSGEEAYISTSAHYIFRMPDGNLELKAVFKLIPSSALILESVTYDSSLEVVSAIGGSAEGGGEIRQGKSVTVKATKANGYTFIGWYFDGKLLSNLTEITFNMPTADTVVKACFMAGEVTLHKLTVEVSPQLPNGTFRKYYAEISGFSEIEHKYPAGWKITVEAVPNATNFKAEWDFLPVDDYYCILDGNELQIGMLAADLKITIRFVQTNGGVTEPK